MGFYLGNHALWCHKHTGVLIASETGDDFFNLVCRDLQTISSTDAGQRLLKMISLRCTGVGQRQNSVDFFGDPDLCVKIHPADWEGETQAGDDCKQAGIRRLGSPGANYRLKGLGTSVIVQYGAGEGWEAKYTPFIGVKSPPFVMLAHELIHALHSLSGDNRGFYTTSDTSNDAAWKHEEARTVGISIYSDNPISENAIRREHRLPRRTTYMQDDAFAGLTSAIVATPSVNHAVSAELIAARRFNAV